MQGACLARWRHPEQRDYLDRKLAKSLSYEAEEILTTIREFPRIPAFTRIEARRNGSSIDG